jgi:hypothetical protein
MYKETMNIRLFASLLLCSIFFSSCLENKTAQIWTDRPEFAFYCEYFNTSQHQYKVTVNYYEFPAVELAKINRKSNLYPDIIIGS